MVDLICQEYVNIVNCHNQCQHKKRGYSFHSDKRILSQFFIELTHCRESVCKWWVAVQGLNHNEVRTISEKVGEQPEYNNEREKRVEWSVPTWTVLNGLEVMGYKVVTCGDYMTGEQRHDQKEFVWTLYKNKEEWENSTK